MTFWTGITTLLGFGVGFGLQMIGLEYGSEHQPISDWMFCGLFLAIILFSLFVDLINICEVAKNKFNRID